MPTLSQVLGNSVPLTVPFEGGEPITITYQASRITQEAYVRLQTFAKNVQTLEVQEQVDGLNQFTIDFVSSWDLSGDDGTPLPITAECLATLPIFIVTSIVTAIQEDMVPNSKAVQVPK